MSATPRPIVVVIDDDLIYREFISTFLRGLDLDVREAEDGDEGTHILSTCAARLVITDLVMPNKDGIEVVRAVIETASEVPVIVLSGRIDGEDSRYEKLVRLMGASATHSKLDAPADILSTVRALLPDWRPPAL